MVYQSSSRRRLLRVSVVQDEHPTRNIQSISSRRRVRGRTHVVPKCERVVKHTPLFLVVKVPFWEALFPGVRIRRATLARLGLGKPARTNALGYR